MRLLIMLIQLKLWQIIEHAILTEILQSTPNRLT